MVPSRTKAHWITSFQFRDPLEGHHRAFPVPSVLPYFTRHPHAGPTAAPAAIGLSRSAKLREWDLAAGISGGPALGGGASGTPALEEITGFWDGFRLVSVQETSGL